MNQSSRAQTLLADELWRPPTLQLGELLLRGYEPSDRDAIFAYASDPEVARYMAWNRHESPEDAQFFLDGIVARHYARRNLDYAVCFAARPEQVVGGVGVFWMPREHQLLELGYVLSRAQWGQGIMTRAARAVVDLAFASTDAEKVFAPIFADNQRSRRVVEKIGFSLEGVLRSEVLLRGRRWDKAMYALLRSDWQARRKDAPIEPSHRS